MKGGSLMEFNIALIGGDGIGPEIVSKSVKVIDKVGKVYGHKFNYIEILAAGKAIDEVGEPLPIESLEQCKNIDAIIIGNIGGRKWSNNPLDKKPEKAILQLRKELDLGYNLRPIFINSALKSFSPLKESFIRNGMDILVVRDITGGMICSDKTSGVGKYGRTACDS
jgi:3-isopropylmalate dehydrogenase